MTRWRGMIIFAGLLVLAGCGGSPPSEPAPPAPAQPAPPAAENAPANLVTAQMMVVDLEGNPLADIAPIATLQPNAFDAPVATGPLSGADGHSSIQFPGDTRVFVRAWDPALRYFPNNFYDIPASGGGATGDMKIEMAQAAVLRMQLVLPDGSPAADENAGLMMLHPAKGPWWPASANTDTNGAVCFPTIPPGSFVLRIKVSSGAQIEIPETPLRPGGTVDLGTVKLQ